MTIGWWFLFLWLVYFLLPFDFLHDRIPYLGRADDLLLLLYLVWLYRKKNRAASKESGHASSDGGTFSGRERAEQQGAGHERADRQAPGQESRARPRDPYRILGIDPSASAEEIKAAYRQQAARYHPDKVSHLGEEFQKLAKEKFQEIQWAYEQLMNRRGKS